jgi:hypothetical protein
MTNKIFYVDLKEAKIVSYKDLFKDISELEVLPKYIYSTSYYEGLTPLILQVFRSFSKLY